MNTALPFSVIRADAGGRRPPPRVELNGALNALFAGTEPSRIVDLDMWPMPYASSFAIDEVTVRFDDGSRLELVCKDTGRAAMLPERSEERRVGKEGRCRWAAYE